MAKLKLLDVSRIGEEFSNINNWVSASASALINVVLLFIFLSVFFWLIISKIETDAITNEVNGAIAQGLPQVYSNLNKKFPFKPYVQKILTKDTCASLTRAFDGPDGTFANNNSWVLTYNITIAIMLVTILIAMIIMIYIFGEKISLWSIIIESAAILCLVGVIEYYFFTTFATKYIPVKPSFLAQQTWQNVLARLDS